MGSNVERSEHNSPEAISNRQPLTKKKIPFSNGVSLGMNTYHTLGQTPCQQEISNTKQTQ